MKLTHFSGLNPVFLIVLAASAEVLLFGEQRQFSNTVESNGYSLRIEYSPPLGFRLWAERSGLTNRVAEAAVSTNEPSLISVRGRMPGPIQVQLDGKAHLLPLRNPAVAVESTYPSELKLSLAERPRHYLTIYPTSTNRGVSVPVMLDDYFVVDTPGTYKVTLHPRLYQRQGPGRPIRRISFPPATLEIAVSRDDLRAAEMDRRTRLGYVR